ncbi:MAG: caspase family protein [Thermoplasmatota archaeon]
MRNLPAALVLLLLLLPFTGCLDNGDAEPAGIARQCYAEIYRPVSDISDIRQDGLPEVDVRYQYAGDSMSNVSVGDLVFLTYRVFLHNVESFEGTAHCLVDGHRLSSRDTEHTYLPTDISQSDMLGLPAATQTRRMLNEDVVYTFRWPYRFASYGVHSIECYLEDANGTRLAHISRNISVDHTETDDDRWALIIGTDPVGNEIAAWKDGVMAFDTLYNHYGFPRDNIMYLSNGCATKQNISNAMEWLGSHTGQASRLVFWISGHGGIEWWGDDDREPRDGTIQVWDGVLYDGDIATFFADTGSMHILSIVDTCYSGEFGGPDDLESVANLFSDDPNMEEKGRVLVTASTTFSRAIATEDGGILTMLMAGALQGITDRMDDTADLNEDGVITAEEAATWAVLHINLNLRYGFAQMNDCHTDDLHLEQ